MPGLTEQQIVDGVHLPRCSATEADCDARVTVGGRVGTVVAVSGYRATVAFDDLIASGSYAYDFSELTPAP